MGRRSRRRVRAGEQPRLQRPPSARGRQSDLSQLIEDLFGRTLEHFWHGQHAESARGLTVLAGWWTDGKGQTTSDSSGLVPELVSSRLSEELQRAWVHGWQPADIPRVIGKYLGQNHARLVVHAIGVDAERYRSRSRTLPSWLDQLDAIGAPTGPDSHTDHLAGVAHELHLDLADLLGAVFDLLVILRRLPPLPLLCPPPSEWDHSAAIDAAMAWRTQVGPGEARHLERIRALLAKAESTEFDEEAESFTAKAQELMTRHSIDAALIAAHTAGANAENRPIGIRLGIEDPYASAKAFLLAQIAAAADCSTVWTKDFGFSTVFGFQAELASVELLYTSLLVQARAAMVRAGESGQRAKSRRFRQSFLVGFATRIGERLRESAQGVTVEAVREHGNDLLPVLAARSEAAAGLRDETISNLKRNTISANDGTGFLRGVASADVATITRGPLLDNDGGRSEQSVRPGAISAKVGPPAA
jgi:hypothetical protein